ncbi:MAG: hypothetical protein ACJAYD_000359 [Patiriisocius sp.]|jgi:hypothetical protein
MFVYTSGNETIIRNLTHTICRLSLRRQQLQRVFIRIIQADERPSALQFE